MYEIYNLEHTSSAEILQRHTHTFCDYLPKERGLCKKISNLSLGVKP
jgi:hypothetical protein